MIASSKQVNRAEKDLDTFAPGPGYEDSFKADISSYPGEHEQRQARPEAGEASPEPTGSSETLRNMWRLGGN